MHEGRQGQPADHSDTRGIAFSMKDSVLAWEESVWGRRKRRDPSWLQHRTMYRYGAWKHGAHLRCSGINIAPLVLLYYLGHGF